MYKISRKPHIKEDLQICHSDGTVAFVLPVDINIDILGGKVRDAIGELGVAQNRLRENPQDLEAYGNAVIAAFNLIFGADGTEKLLEFYENNYTEMLVDIYPFIQGEILPKVQAASAARKAELLQLAPKKKGLFR